jgi:hypothetical protein
VFPAVFGRRPEKEKPTADSASSKAPVAASDAILVAILQAVEPALINRGTGCTAAARRGGVTGIKRWTVDTERMGFGRATVVEQQSQLRVNAGEVAGRVAEDGAVSRILNQVIAS